MEHGVAESEEIKRVTVAPHRLLATEKLTTFGRSRVSCANYRGPVYLALQDDAA